MLSEFLLGLNFYINIKFFSWKDQNEEAEYSPRPACLPNCTSLHVHFYFLFIMLRQDIEPYIYFLHYDSNRFIDPKPLTEYHKFCWIKGFEYWNKLTSIISPS